MEKSKVEEFFKFMQQPVHLKDGVIVFDSLKNGSINDTGYFTKSLRFLNIQNGSKRFTGCNVGTTHVEIYPLLPERDRKGNIFARPIKIIVREGEYQKRLIVTDEWLKLIKLDLTEIIFELCLDIKSKILKCQIIGVDCE